MDRANEAGSTLVFMPDNRDETRIVRTLHDDGLACEACSDAEHLAHRLTDPRAEVGAVIASRSALQMGGRKIIKRFQQTEPAWSSLPVVLFAPDHTELPLRNVVLLQDPTPSQELLTVMKVALGFRTRQRELRGLHERLERLALGDPLTGLPNRTALYHKLVELQRERRAGDAAFTAVFLDLDSFKSINDTYGHAAGDEALRQIARHLEHSVRSDDFVARLSGDEFIVLLIGSGSAKRAADAAQRLARGVQIELAAKPGPMFVAISAGVLERIAGDATPDAILARADAQMYAQKHSKWRGRSAS